MNNPKPEVTINQIAGLIDFMEEHPELALGQFQRSKEGRCLSRRLWEQCALALNAVKAGSTKDAEGWREYFKAYKARLKKIITKKSLNATGGGSPAVLQLTPLQERLHAILGVDVGKPLPGVQHDPLSQTLTTERPTVGSRQSIGKSQPTAKSEVATDSESDAYSDTEPTIEANIEELSIDTTTNDPIDYNLDFRPKKRKTEVKQKDEQERDEVTMFGELMMYKMRKLNSQNRLIAQNKINNILFELEMEEMKGNL